MAGMFDNELLREGILRYKCQEFPSARRFLERALENADDEDTRKQAHYYLSLLTEDPVEKRGHLEEVLAIDLAHAPARRALAVLDGRLPPDQGFNPDAPAREAVGQAAGQPERFTCPGCGGRMLYAPDGIALVCESCQRSEQLRAGNAAPDQDFLLAMAAGRGHRTPVATQVFHCQGCAAEFILEGRQISTTCSFCGSLHVVRLSRELAAPDALLPFGFDPARAGEVLAGWMSRHRVEADGEIQPPRALYLPVWTFNVSGQVPWNGRVYRNRRMLPVSGQETLSVRNLAVAAAGRPSELLRKVIRSFDLAAPLPYDPRYLVGWPAQVYELSMSDASLEARRMAIVEMRLTIRAQHGEVQDLSYSAASLAVESFQLVLVPVWFADLPVSGRTCRVVLNGLSGAAFGETPTHSLRAWLGELLDPES